MWHKTNKTGDTRKEYRWQEESGRGQEERKGDKRKYTDIESKETGKMKETGGKKKEVGEKGNKWKRFTGGMWQEKETGDKRKRQVWKGSIHVKSGEKKVK
jgi:hypothetical protein